jgi:methyltransferase
MAISTIATSTLVYFGLLLMLALERLIELRISARNAAWAFERGGKEFGQSHLFPMKLLHTALFIGCVAEVLLLSRPFVLALAAPMMLLAVLSQALRYWTIMTLGPRWNVRVIVVDSLPPVTSGPFRLVRHPNYLAVIVEGIAVPLIHGAFVTAAVFSVLNAWLLSVRIRCEERALAGHRDYLRLLGQKARFTPRL